MKPAGTEEQFQAVGMLCRETLISLAQEVFDPIKHPTQDGVEASATDAKRMLQAYIATAFAGDANEHIRKHARAAYDLSVQLQHRRTATFRDAAACVRSDDISGKSNRNNGRSPRPRLLNRAVTISD